ncbi:MAG: hypothetical protein WC742_07935 [Gallionellaceae bacterium]|jgi:hypothetical protein
MTFLYGTFNERSFSASLRRHYIQLITSGTQLFLLAIGAQLQTREAWLWSLGLIAFISLCAWLSVLYRWRAIVGTPTSKIASAAQGYVELIGKGKYFNATPLISPLLQLPCLWFRYRIEHKNSKHKWHAESAGESAGPFLLDDGSGVCVIDPANAEIIAAHKDTWNKGEYRYTEWRLANIDRLYALGEFKTLGGSTAAPQTDDEIKAVLAEWKTNRTDLHARFDLNNDGELDMREWAVARRAAHREAEKRVNLARSAPDTHYLVQPADGRLFLLSNLTPEQLVRHYSVWTWGHLFIFFGALSAIAWVI